MTATPTPTILVVDDSPESLGLLANLLTLEGYQVRQADSGEVALSAVAASAPDLILLDVRMKRLSGFEVCRRLKAADQTRRIPVILISASADVAARVEGMEAGAVDYIAKPFHAADLLARAKTQLALAQTSANLRRVEEELRLGLQQSERSRLALFGALEDQRIASAALRVSTEYLQLALKTAAMGVWRSDLRNDTIQAIQGGGPVSGLPAEICPRSAEAFKALVHPDDRVDWSERFRLAIELGEPYQAEFRIVLPDHSVRWVSARGTCSRDAAGRAIELVGVDQDITARKQIEEALLFLARASGGDSPELFFRPLARYLAGALGADYICIDRLVGDQLTAETLAVFLDGSFNENIVYRLVDTPCGDVVGRDVCVIPSGVRHKFPQDVALQDLGAEGYIGVTLWGGGGKPIGLIAAISRHPITNPALAESILRLVAVRAAAELERSLTEQTLKKSMADLNEAQRVSGVGSWTWHIPTKYLEWSDEMYRIYGVAKDAFTGNLDDVIARVVHPDDLPILEQFIRVVEAHGRPGPIEYRVVWPDGTVRVVCAAPGELLCDEAGQPAELSGTAQDITARKETQQVLERQKQLIETVLEHSPIGFAVNRIDSGVGNYVSARFEDIYGVPRGSIHTVGDYFNLVYTDPGQREQLRTRIMADMATGDAARMRWEDIPLTTASGERKFVTAINIPLIDQNLMVSTVQDVTASHDATRGLQQQAEELRANNADLARFNRAAVDRELRMIALKREVNDLLRRLGEAPRYRESASGPAEATTPDAPGRPS